MTEERATIKQIDLLKKLGVPAPNIAIDLTKKGASDWIKELIDGAKNGDVKPEVVKVPDVPKSNGFKLTEESIRSNALRCAIEHLETNEVEHLWTMVESFEKYIRNGN